MSSQPPSRSAHLETLRADVRDEIKRRLEQRDKFSIQLTISLGAILAIAFSKPELSRVLVAAPLVSIYFTVLILYSYRIHAVLTQYLREKLEPELASVVGLPVDFELETYYSKHAVAGIRKAFFLAALWIVTLGSLAYLFSSEYSHPFKYAVGVLAALYLVAWGLVTWAFAR
jgi:hypothetical protein